MVNKTHPLAGTRPEVETLVDISGLVTAFFTGQPDPSVASERVAFGTSGHRGSSTTSSFNEWHVLAITQAICDYRTAQSVSGPLFLGKDTHALSVPAHDIALEVLAANGVEVMLASDDEYTPTPALSHAILTYNHGRRTRLADGIVMTPSHNPPDNGGFKYNPTHGGPADTDVTRWIEQRANAILEAKLHDVKRIPLAQALSAATTHRHDYLGAYVDDLATMLDFPVIRAAGVALGVDPLGGAGVHYWPRIAEQYGLNLSIVNDIVDPTFRFMTLDWDGRIRMDPSSQDAMRGLIAMKDRFDVAFACDTDHDRHGIVTRSRGLLPSNDYLSLMVHYLFQNRSGWQTTAAVGKTVVTSAMLDRIAAALRRQVYEVPVGFKWFVDGLLGATLGFGGEESAGASFLRTNGSVWTTDKDGIVAALLAGEITARLGQDPGEAYAGLAHQYGEPQFQRVDAPATPAQKNRLAKLSARQVTSRQLAGEKIERILTEAPGNGAPIGGVKVIAASGWFAARPSGTEDIYKIYAESFRGRDHLQLIMQEAQAMVDDALAAQPDGPNAPEHQ